MRTETGKGRRCIVGLMGAVVASIGARADWSTYQGDSSHTGYVAGSIPASNLALRWSSPLSTYALGGMAVGGNGVYVKIADSSSIVALNEQSGTTLWRNANTPVNYALVLTTAPAYSGGMVYYQTDSNNLNQFHGVNATTGASVFATNYAAQWETYLNPTPYAGIVYTGGGEYGGMYAYNAGTGNTNWFGADAQYDGWTPAVDGKYAYSFTGSGDTTPILGQFRMVNLASGATTYLVTDNNFQFNSYTMNSAVVLGPHNDAFTINEAGSTNGPTAVSAGRLLAFSTQVDATHTPHIAWTLADHFTGQPTLANGVIYADDGGSIVALNESTGATLWSWTPPTGKITGNLIATDNVLFAGTPTTTYALDLGTHTPDWSYGVSGNLAFADNTLFVAGSNGTMSAFQTPEPSAIALAAIGALSLARTGRRRRMRA